MNKVILSDLFLFIVTIGWGYTYLMTKGIIKEMSPFTLLWTRFAISSFLFYILFFRKIEITSKKFIFQSIVCGIILWCAFVMQVYGIQFSTPGKAGLVTGLFVIFVPVLYTLLERKKLSKVTILGSLLSFAGLFLFSLEENIFIITIGKGDYILIFSAFFYALHIIYIDKTYMQFENLNVFSFILVQMITVFVLSLPPALLFEKFPEHISTSVIWGGMYNILIGTILAYSAQIVVQKYSPPTHISLIMVFESVFAFFFSWLFYGEVITWKTITGASLMIFGIIITAVYDRK
jgi:drug/metabolite transporter (DMT)-like permease